MTTPALTPAAPEPRAARRFSLRQRIALWLISWAGYLAVRLIGPTLRFTLTVEEGASADPPMPGIFPFWHNCVFPATWFFRGRGFAVMTSHSFDGEYIARIIERFGYVAVRGSSSYGGAKALLEMRRMLEHGHGAAFTIDGPRGPRYVAKPGPVALARATGVYIQPFYVALHNPWVLRTWDGFMLPRPFSRALVRGARPIQVPADADEETLRRCHAEMQTALERVRDWAMKNVGTENVATENVA